MADTLSSVQRTRIEGERRNLAAVARARLASDWAAVGLLFVLTALVAWNRADYDMWFYRADILQWYLPTYYHLGQQLRDFDIPGWNPHQFSGAPFAADPQSGWMQFPVMVLFSLLDHVTALKGLMAFNLALGVFSTYAFARVLGMGIVAGIVGAISLGFISLIQFNTDCCTIMGNLAPWIPLALLGIELAVRMDRWVYRLAAIFLTGLALSQMLAAWIGQGAYYALLLIGSYVFYRTVISPVGDGWTIQKRVTALIVAGFLILLTGFALGAAGVWPRLDVNRYTSLSGGNYEALGAGGGNGWGLDLMLDRMLDSEYVARRLYIGTVVVMLAILAPFLARLRFAVPFFSVLSVVCLILTLDTTPVHQLFYLLPRFRVLHEHSEYRILGIFYIGPAMLAAASVDSLLRMRGRARTIALAFIPLAVYAIVAVIFEEKGRNLPLHVWVLVGVVTLLLVAFLVLRSDLEWGFLHSLRPFAAAIPVLLVALLLADPAGKDIYEAVRGRSSSAFYQVRFDHRPEMDEVVTLYSTCPGEGEPETFLYQELDAQGVPFRYFGYDPEGLRYQSVRGTAYQNEVTSPVKQSLLVGNRSTCLGLFDVQGYNPIQIQRYVEFLRQINGVELNYHDGVILQSGIDSPLIDLLNPAYFIVPSEIPPPEDRPDLNQLVQTYPTVFDNGIVRVLEKTDALPRAWIVHDVRQMPKEEILGARDSATVDPRQTAVIEASPPPVTGLPSGSTEHVQVARYEPDRISLDVMAAADGMLVLSEIYLPGWNAYIDGEHTDVHAANYVLRGIPITSGTHRVELRYEPASLRYGVWISVVAGLVMLSVFGSAAWCWMRGRQATRTPG